MTAPFHVGPAHVVLGACLTVSPRNRRASHLPSLRSHHTAPLLTMANSHLHTLYFRSPRALFTSHPHSFKDFIPEILLGRPDNPSSPATVPP